MHSGAVSYSNLSTANCHKIQYKSALICTTVQQLRRTRLVFSPVHYIWPQMLLKMTLSNSPSSKTPISIPRLALLEVTLAQDSS